jgi:recombination protein RecT
MSTAVALRDKVTQIGQTIDRPEFQQQLREALPPSVSVEKFTRTTKLAVQLNPEIVEADRQSLFLAMVKCAKDGLLPDGREAALVKVRVKGKDTVAYWPMIGGFRRKAAEAGFSIEAHAVYSADTFEYELGFEPRLVHKVPPLSEPRGELIGAYAVGTGPDGQKFLEVMGREEIEAVRATSRAATSEYGPWVKWPAEMYRKTVARRLFKQLPIADLDDRARTMLQADDEAHRVAATTAAEPALAALPVLIDDEADDEPEQEVIFEPEEV